MVSGLTLKTLFGHDLFILSLALSVLLSPVLTLLASSRTSAKCARAAIVGWLHLQILHTA